MITLSEEAKTKLRIILQKDIGVESAEMLNDANINEIGIFLLSVFSESLKMKDQQK